MNSPAYFEIKPTIPNRLSVFTPTLSDENLRNRWAYRQTTGGFKLKVSAADCSGDPQVHRA
jgi:hypothetical protein